MTSDSIKIVSLNSLLFINRQNFVLLVYKKNYFSVFIIYQIVFVQVYDLLMNYLNTKAHTIDFPEMTFGMLYTLKKYIKSSKATEYRNMMRRIVQKIKENKNFIIGKISKIYSMFK